MIFFVLQEDFLCRKQGNMESSIVGRFQSKSKFLKQLFGRTLKNNGL